MNDSQHVILVLGDKPNKWQEREAQYVLRQALDENSSRRVVPVVTSPAAFDSMPGVLRSLQSYDLSSGSVEDAARQIGNAISDARGGQEPRSV